MTRHLSKFALVLFLAVALFLVVRARAAPWVIDTLELRVTEADIVARGTLESFAPTRNSYEARGTFHVIETLKGNAGASIECYLPHSTLRRLEAWQKDKVELLLCLVKTNRKTTDPELANVEWAILERYSGPEGLIPLNGDPDPERERPVPTADFQLLTRSDDILKAAREAIHVDAVSKMPRQPGEVTSVTVDPPINSPVAKIPVRTLPAVRLVVNEALEPQARQWLKADDWRKKRSGIGVLSNFKSDENIAALKPLLTDTSSAQFRLEGREVITTYPVRASALQVLQSWGVEATAELSTKKPTVCP